MAKGAASIAAVVPDSLEDLHIHQQRLAEQLAASSEHRIQKLVADAWCAAFVQPKTMETRATAITHGKLEKFAADAEPTLELAAAETWSPTSPASTDSFTGTWSSRTSSASGVTGIDRKTGWAGGFSCVIGNPPWER